MAARTARPKRPSPAAMPTAAVVQMLAAVVRPRICRVVGELEDGAGADEPNAGSHTLHDARHIRRRHAGLERRQDEQGRAQRDENVRPQARGLPRLFALEPQQCAEEPGGEHPQDNADGFGRIRQAKAQFVDQRLHHAVPVNARPARSVISPMAHLRLALRTLLRTPFVTAVAVASLAFGIGANAAIFSMFDQMLLRSLPVAEPERLVNLGAPGPKPGSQSCSQQGPCSDVFSYAMFRDLEKVQEPLSAWRRTSASAPTCRIAARR